MGNAGRHHAPPYLPVPQTAAPTAAAQEAVILPGGGIRATRDFRGGRGIKIEIENVGPGACEVEGHLISAGKTAEVSVPDGTHEDVLDIWSVGKPGTRVSIKVIAWRPAPPPRLILSVRKTVVRDEKTKLIREIIESPVWVPETPR